jgi:alkylation response protein AidB-like acyl-CoA dehydrogenase
MMSLTAPDVDLVTPIREFFDRRVTSDYRHALLSGGGWDPDLIAELDDLGWFELTRPENRGGLGIDLTAVAGLIALVGDRLVPGPLVEQLILPAYLDIPEGSLVAFADPAVTLDWASSIGYVHMESGQIQGTIELVRFGAEADSLVLAVDGPDGPALLLLPGSDPALTLTPISSSDPTSHYVRLEIASRTVADAEILATGIEAATLLRQIRAWFRLLTACEISGIARRMLEKTVEYVAQRQQFGKPVGSFQAVKHIAASMAQATISMEALCEATVSDIASADVDFDIEMATWTAKAYAAGAGRQVVEDALQLHGGIGFTTEYDLHWYYRRVLALRTWYGDEHELHALIGSRRLTDGVDR